MNDWMSCHDLTAPVARLRSSTRVGSGGRALAPPRADPCAPPSPGVAAGGVAGAVPTGGAPGGTCAGVAGGVCPGGTWPGVGGGALAGDPGGAGGPGGAAAPPPGAAPPPRPRPPRPPPVGPPWYASHLASAENTPPLPFG